MLYILYGQDDFSLGQSLDGIKRGIGDQTAVAANTVILEGQQVILAQLRAICETAPFLAEKRLVIVRGLLERFEARGRTGRQKKATPATDQQNGYKVISDYITTIPDSTILVLIEGEIKSNNPLFKALSARAEVKSFPLLRGAKLRQWVQEKVAAEGVSISPQAVELLAKLVGSNLWIMASEVNKLALFALGRRIEEEDVKLVVSHAERTSVFAMVDAILEFKAGEAEGLLQQLLQWGATPAYLLVMLTRQVRMVVRAKELKSQGKSLMEIQGSLGLSSDYSMRRTLEQAKRYSVERLRQVYRKLLEADLSIKTGRYGRELTLNILIAELCERDR